MSSLSFTLSIVAPVFLIVFAGYFLKKGKLIDEHFNRTASRVVFRVTLPCLVFEKIATTHFTEVFNVKQMVFANVGVITMVVVAWFIVPLLTRDGRSQGAFIQGSFRSNFSIIGFALINNAFGPDALAQAAILLAFIMPLLNILAVIVLTVPLHKGSNTPVTKIIYDVITNPLIIAVLVSLPFSLLGTTFHPVISRTIGYLAQLTLPLALLAIGGSLSFHRVRHNAGLVLAAAANKIVLMPLLFTWIAIELGFRGLDLGVLFFLFGCPTAIVSYIMADAMGSNSELAGDIILFTTMGSVLTLSAGILILKGMGYF